MPDPQTGEVKILNDFVIKDTGLKDERHRGRHLRIRFSPEHNSFMMRDLGTGFGTFYKVKQPVVIRGNQLLSIGHSYLLLSVNDTHDAPQRGGFLSDLTNLMAYQSTQNTLKIKVFGGKTHGSLIELDPIKL
jgi:hypothetical protein